MPDVTGSDTAARAAAILERLSIEEKVALLCGRDMWNLGGVADVPRIWVADGPHGLRKQSGSPEVIGLGDSAPATCFPPAATLACSWDPGLAEEVGRAIGVEARASGVSVVLGPGLNLKRHPCCGRNFEYYSEDPLLSGRMAGGLVRGLQSAGVGGCLKHFAANNQEANRMVTDAVVDERSLRELYLAGFEVAIAESAPWTVMCAYNRINGVYCSENRWLLTKVLREEWGFGGLVMSDWGAVNDRVAGVTAGLDLEMPGGNEANAARVRTALADGRLAQTDVDAAALRVVELALRAAATLDSDASCDADAHHALARRAAAESAVLLANDGILPLEACERIAVLGSFAESPRYQGAGSSEISPTRLDNALEALRERLEGGTVIDYVRVYDPVTGELEPGGLAAAADAAATADVALVFVGLPPTYEAEGFDREHIRLPECHDRLVEEACASSPRVVVVLSGGSPVELPWAGRPAAILHTSLGGQAGGSAVVDVLLGDVAPGGRLAETYPLTLADVPADANFPGAPRQVEYREGLYVGYRYFTSAKRETRFCFGHGLTYTTFAYGDPHLSSARIRAGEGVEVTVPVANTGPRAGSAVVQVYLHAVEPTVHRPARELAGFAKVMLGPGETRNVVITLASRAFAFFDVVSGTWQTEGGAFEVLVGASVEDIVGTTSLRVDSGFVPALSPVPKGYIADEGRFAGLLGHPLPVPERTLPYTRNSTIGDLRQTALGRLVRTALMTAMRRTMQGDAASDPVRATMLERIVSELPLRQLVMASGGRLSWRTLDGLIAVLNTLRLPRGRARRPDARQDARRREA